MRLNLLRVRTRSVPTHRAILASLPSLTRRPARSSLTLWTPRSPHPGITGHTRRPTPRRSAVNAADACGYLPRCISSFSVPTALPTAWDVSRPAARDVRELAVVCLHRAPQKIQLLHRHAARRGSSSGSSSAGMASRAGWSGWFGRPRAAGGARRARLAAWTALRGTANSQPRLTQRRLRRRLVADVLLGRLVLRAYVPAVVVVLHRRYPRARAERHAAPTNGPGTAGWSARQRQRPLFQLPFAQLQPERRRKERRRVHSHRLLRHGGECNGRQAACGRWFKIKRLQDNCKRRKKQTRFQEKSQSQRTITDSR